MIFNYKVLQIETPQEAESQLEKHALEGWKLVSTVPIEDFGTTEAVWIVLERREGN